MIAAGSIVVCLLTFNEAWFGVRIKQQYVRARSLAVCQGYVSSKANGLAGGGFYYTLPQDKEKFERMCGPDGVDCPEVH